jgi:hypothetical protein
MKMENANKASEATPETAPKTARFPERLKADVGFTEKTVALCSTMS